MKPNFNSKNITPLNLQTSAQEFIHSLQSLEPSNRPDFFRSHQSNLAKLITRSDDLSIILSLLGPQEKSIVFDALKFKLPQIIQTGEQLVSLFKCSLTKGQMNALFRHLKPKIHTLVDCNYTLINLYNAYPLDNDQKEFLFLHACASKIITKPIEVEYLFQLLSADSQEKLLRVYKHTIRSVYEESRDNIVFRFSMNALYNKNHFQFWDSLKRLFPEFIYQYSDIYTNEKKRHDLKMDKKWNQHNTINNLNLLYYVLENPLNRITQSQASLIEEVLPQLPRLIKNFNHFSFLYSLIQDPSQKALVFNHLKPHLPHLFPKHHMFAFKDFFKQLSSLSQYNALIQAFKDRILLQVTSPTGAGFWFSQDEKANFSISPNDTIFDCLKLDFIRLASKRISALCNVLEHIGPIRQLDLLKKIKDCLPKLIKSQRDYDKVVQSVQNNNQAKELIPFPTLGIYKKVERRHFRK